MKNFPIRAGALAALMSAAALAPAYADDRAPNADERAKIEAALKAEGFASWGSIELDDGRTWEVDDARHSDGREYDLELSMQTLAITDRDED